MSAVYESRDLYTVWMYAHEWKSSTFQTAVLTVGPDQQAPDIILFPCLQSLILGCRYIYDYYRYIHMTVLFTVVWKPKI